MGILVTKTINKMKKIILSFVIFTVTSFTISAQSSSFDAKKIKLDSSSLKIIMTSPLLDVWGYAKEKIKKQDSLDYAHDMSVSLDTVLLFHCNYNKISFIEAIDIFLNQVVYQKRIIELREFYSHNFRRYKSEEEILKKQEVEYKLLRKLAEEKIIIFNDKDPMDYR